MVRGIVIFKFKKMKAIVRHVYGNPDVLKIAEIPKPIPKDNEVLVRVHCTTVNSTDCSILTGKPYIMRFFTGLLKPASKIPGTDFAGEITEIGEQVTQFKVGDRVWGLNDQGLASQAVHITVSIKLNSVLAIRYWLMELQAPSVLPHYKF